MKNGNSPFDLATVRRCGARRKRDGMPCRCPAMKNGRCARHGGKSTGPRTLEGLARAATANWKNGFYSRAMIEDRRFMRALLAANRAALAKGR
ncbi:MAG: hypothetical protein IT350_02270 [Deltaproteobacteria bacterium]|nr:hypothetical protein [Deltaproteobacteria bacterium]